MKRIVLFLFLTAAAILAACGASGQSSGSYQVVIIGGNEDLSGAFSDFAGSGGPVGELRYIADPEEARKEFPKYSFEEVPAIFIFETGGSEMKKLMLETNDVEEAQAFLEGKD
ncbi:MULTISPECIES: hypothetical protein [Bacillaceae]|uniref:hypothetical protein n=1 Tax=Bacillaceae TaxID=186817 RepID=UPI002003EEBF|nr:hypothetical protein [Bacillus infantis]MCK6207867.1 hypothetical protein [Bacillus infantis]MDW2878657.1 hypothetical protein [Bacillus infantis]